MKTQEELIAKLEQPRAPKASQPIHDVGKLHSALAQAKDYHAQVVNRDQEAIDACHTAIQQAQQALKMAQEIQDRHKSEATAQINLLLALIVQK